MRISSSSTTARFLECSSLSDLPLNPREVLRAEADAIAAAADRLDETAFTTAAELIAGCVGKVLTTGAGKSGIIARKIAGSMTSTGTPAMFLHPSDALHGDLGAIEPEDVVLAISNSGETEELLALLPYLREREVPLIALVGNLRSTLSSHAAVTLDAAVAREADPLDLVPTSSTAVALALGDALALAAMQARGVTPERFARNHPSGRLGRRLTLRVRDLMHAPRNASVDLETAWIDVVSRMSAGGLGAVVVLDEDGSLLGIVTDGDVRRTVQNHDPEELRTLTAASFMTQAPAAIEAECLAYDALRTMEDRPSQIAVLPVLQDGRCVGLLRLHDLVRAGL